jgi:hypothetical protein
MLGPNLCLFFIGYQVLNEIAPLLKGRTPFFKVFSVLIDGGDAADLSGYMVQYLVCYNRANTEPLGAVGGKATTEVMEAPIGNATNYIKASFNLAETRYRCCSVCGEKQRLAFYPRQGSNDVLRLIRQLDLMGSFILGPACG